MPMWAWETTMLRHTWVKPQVRHLSIALHFQHLCHLLVSALIPSQGLKEQVFVKLQICSHFWEYTCHAEQTKKPLQVLDMNLYNLFFSLFVAASTLTTSSVFTPRAMETSTVEVGQGNLRLTFSADVGKMTHYTNSRSLVCNVQALHKYCFIETFTFLLHEFLSVQSVFFYPQLEMILLVLSFCSMHYL